MFGKIFGKRGAMMMGCGMELPVFFIGLILGIVIVIALACYMHINIVGMICPAAAAT